MFKIDFSKLMGKYVPIAIYFLLGYNIIIHELPMTTNIPIQLLISLNFIAVGLYALFKENIVLTSSVHNKISIISKFIQFAPLWELSKLLPLSRDYVRENFVFCYIIIDIIYYNCYLLFNRKYPQFFEKFTKFNFGFTIQYLILATFNIQVNEIIPCTILGIVFIYFASLTLDHMTVFVSNIIFCVVLIEAWIPLVIILSPSKDEAAVLFGFFIAGVATLLIYLVAVILQIRKVNNGAYDAYGEVKKGDDIEEGTAIASQVNNSNNNYSTFSN